MRLITGVLLAGVLAGCAGSSSVQQDQVFLRMTAYNNDLSAIDVTTRVHLGHEMCGLLKKHHGDVSAAGAEMTGGSAVLAPAMPALASDAAVAYCPEWR